ncbi:MAG: putative damage-inducible protein DinB [Candidatus Endobugula sp.]
MKPLSISLSNLISCNLSTLTVASDMIRRLPAGKYNYIEKPYFESCLGKHIRHVLDHYLCFVRDFESGVINYEQRQRESQLETDKDYALVVIGEIEQFFNQLIEVNAQDHELSVLLCNDVELPQGEATQSSVRRELQFLQGHSVHHYALIAAMLRFYGIDTSREFGVAPSTLIHEKIVKVSA